ncbi:unnamed protein product, partial [Effrenium voratum]
MFVGGYFLRKVRARAAELDKMDGFSKVPLTTVMGGFIMGGNPDEPFINTKEVQVADFFRAVTAEFGHRWVFTWNLYPYFDPNVQVDFHDERACRQVMEAASSFEEKGMMTSVLRDFRKRTAK